MVGARSSTLSPVHEDSAVVENGIRTENAQLHAEQPSPSPSHRQKAREDSAMGLDPQLSQKNSERWSRRQNDQSHPTKAEERLREISCMFSEASRVDLLFLVDSTGSMDAYIQKIRERITVVVVRIRKLFPELRLRLSFVGYRDFSDGFKRLEILPFTENVSEFTSFVRRVEAFGGGDFPEDVFGGLDAAAKQAWLSRTRVLVHIADAPCHGEQFQVRARDWEQHRLNDRGCDRNGLRAKGVLTAVQNRSLAYYFHHVHKGATQEMLKEFRKIVRSRRYKIYEIDLEENPEKVGAAIVKAVKGSVSTTLCTLTKGNVAHGLETLTSTIPVWSKQETLTAVTSWFSPPLSVEDLVKGVELERRERRLSLKLATRPFAEGAQRYAYYGQDLSLAQDAQLVVIKQHKHPAKLEVYGEQMELQTIATFFADIFNKGLAAKKCDKCTINFLDVGTIELLDYGTEFYGNLEPFLRGRYEKFNSNAGYVADRQELHAVVQAFSHWTHSTTRGHLIVVDLQGVRADDVFVLTDPAIHCEDVCRFGKTNLGKRGIETFFKTHRCNSICRKLRLKHPDDTSSPPCMSLFKKLFSKLCGG